MGGPGSGAKAPEVRFVVVSWKNTATGRRQATRPTLEEAIGYGDALLAGRLADHYAIERIETLARRSRQSAYLAASSGTDIGRLSDWPLFAV